MFECKTFVVLKSKKTFVKTAKLKICTFVEYLMNYNFTNIFRIWNLYRKTINNYKNFIFNKTLFFKSYDKKQLKNQSLWNSIFFIFSNLVQLNNKNVKLLNFPFKNCVIAKLTFQLDLNNRNNFIENKIIVNQNN